MIVGVCGRIWKMSSQVSLKVVGGSQQSGVQIDGTGNIQFHKSHDAVANFCRTKESYIFVVVFWRHLFLPLSLGVGGTLVVWSMLSETLLRSYGQSLPFCD